jgi:hypothetical protein
MGLLLLLSLARSWAQYPQPLSAAWVLFALALAWSVLVRPAVVIDVAGVTLRNLVRDVHIPWSQLDDVTTRWNLRVLAGERGYTAWAVSSQSGRPRARSAGLRVPSAGLPAGGSGADSRVSATSLKVTAENVSRWIRAAKQDYDEAVALGHLSPIPDGKVRVTWVPLVVAALLMPAIAVVVLTLI